MIIALSHGNDIVIYSLSYRCGRK